MNNDNVMDFNNLDKLDCEKFIKGRCYAIKLKDIKQFSYTNLNEPFHDFNLQELENQDKKYGKIYTPKYGKIYTPVTFNHESLIKRIRMQRCAIVVEYIGGDCFQDIETDTIFHVATNQLKEFDSLEEIEQDITYYCNNYMSIFSSDVIIMFDEKIEKQYRWTMEQLDDMEELFEKLNCEIEKSLQINLIQLATNEMIDAVYEGNTHGESKKLIKEMRNVKNKIGK